MEELLPIDRREAELDRNSAKLIEHIRRSLAIHTEMFHRVLDTIPQPSLTLAELLEDAGNRYLDFSDLVSSAHRASLQVEK